MNRRHFLSGMVAAVANSELVVQASDVDILRFGRGDQVVVSQGAPSTDRPEPFPNLGDMVFVERKGKYYGIGFLIDIEAKLSPLSGRGLVQISGAWATVNMVGEVYR